MLKPGGTYSNHWAFKGLKVTRYNNFSASNFHFDVYFLSDSKYVMWPNVRQIQ